MENSQIDLYEFLIESELQHYYSAVKNELKIINTAQFRYASDEDLKNIGLSKPEIRRLRKFYEKYFPHGYLSKIKRLLQTPATIVKRDEGDLTLYSSELFGSTKTLKSSRISDNKHIIPANSISVNKQLGTGEFGIVQQGVWTNGTNRIQVAIKCLCRERMQSNPMEFLKEAAIMHSIEHENIVRLYGVVLSIDSLMLVTELAHLRSLLECLKDSGLRVSFLTVPTLCEFAVQICNGMRYLENKRLIHRDLAARNILVFSKNKIKISDFGLSRALGVGKDYYKTNFNVNLKLPIAWCAPECINYLRFTNASDVWAFAVCLWEMFSYGFQPWAALTGLQILEAIDAPNFQRLEQPDCCPKEYYSLMMKCWQDDPTKRPKFSEIYAMLPDMKPEQLKAVVNNFEARKDHLLYRQGEIITVLDRHTDTCFWKGVLTSGKVGLFNPSNTVAYLEGLPCSNRDSFCRMSERSSKRKLKTEMISKPQNDFKHTGHVGIDGVSFGDVAFLSNSQSYNYVPRQIVTPYKPSEDIEQTPLLLPPTPTSPDSLQTASGYFPDITNTTAMNPSFVSSTENTPKYISNTTKTSFEFPGYQIQTPLDVNIATNPFCSVEELTRESSKSIGEDQHEYHEISDDEITADKFDFGPSLLDEINSMFGSMNTGTNCTKTSIFEHGNPKKEFSLITSKLVNKGNTGDSNRHRKKAAGTVKPISVKDEKILNHAIEIANEISARSMIDLVSAQPSTTQSPKRKFSFRFPHLSNNGVNEKSGSNSSLNGAANNVPQSGSASPFSKKKNFTEELKSYPDLQAIIGEEGREAYSSLIERATAIGDGIGLSPAAKLLRHLDTNEFEMATAKTLPRRAIHSRDDDDIILDELITVDNQRLVITCQNTPRPMTLPTRGSGNRWKDDLHSNTPHLNKDCSNFAVSNGATHGEPPSGSPSYMSTTSYRFPLKKQVLDLNPVPLPSRDGKKHIKKNPKRHVRKYPLIIPANGVQRTLSKVTEPTPTGDGINCLIVGVLGRNESNLHHLKHEVIASTLPSNKMSPPYENTFCEITSHTYQNMDEHTKEICLNTDSASLQFESILEADFDKGNVLQSPDVTDGFYNFSIQKEHYNKCKEIGIDPKISGLYVNEDELRNLDIERNLKVTLHNATSNTIKILPSRPTVFETVYFSAQNSMPEAELFYGSASSKERAQRETIASNELTSNALFRKVRESLNVAMNKNDSGNAESQVTSEQIEANYFATNATGIADSNSVSCEDLLEFSNKKPKGCERGVDSDEVRIMMKVLGKDNTPERSLHVLDFVNWDVHKSIKVIKLQNILENTNLTVAECVEALQESEWDLHITTMKLKGLTS